jgi:hypothetical protein
VAKKSKFRRSYLKDTKAIAIDSPLTRGKVKCNFLKNFSQEKFLEKKK